LGEVLFYEKKPFYAGINKDGFIILSRNDDDGIFVSSTILHVDRDQFGRVSLVAHGHSCGTPNRHKIVHVALRELLTQYDVEDIMKANDKNVMRGVYDRMLDDVLNM